MTSPLDTTKLAELIETDFPGSVTEWRPNTIFVRSEKLLEVCHFLKDTPELQLDYLNSISAIDYIEYFELVYHLTSTSHNHSTILKTVIYGRENPSVPSVMGVWQGADYQEREVWDLMGIVPIGHPNLKRILLWEGFPGHPLRKDYVDTALPPQWPRGG